MAFMAFMAVSCRFSIFPLIFKVAAHLLHLRSHASLARTRGQNQKKQPEKKSCVSEAQTPPSNVPKPQKVARGSFRCHEPLAAGKCCRIMQIEVLVLFLKSRNLSLQNGTGQI